MSKKILLSDLFPLKQSVELVEGVPESCVTARPLKLPEIVTLLMSHKEGLLALYNESQQPSPNYSTVLLVVPNLVTDIICLGVSELADQRGDVEALPPGTLLQLLASVWELSVPDPKKFIESLSKLMGQVARLASTAKETLVVEPPTMRAPVTNPATGSS